MKAELTMNHLLREEIEARLGYKLDDPRAVQDPTEALNVVKNHFINMDPVEGAVAVGHMDRAIAAGAEISLFVTPRVTVLSILIDLVLMTDRKKLVVTYRPSRPA